MTTWFFVGLDVVSTGEKVGEAVVGSFVGEAVDINGACEGAGLGMPVGEELDSAVKDTQLMLKPPPGKANSKVWSPEER